MPAYDTDLTDGSFESALREGVLGEEYELVGVYNEEPGEAPGFEYELFIVSAGSEA